PDSRSGSDRDERQRSAQHQSQNLSRLRANRNPDSDLASTLGDRVRDHTAESHGCDAERDTREDAHEQRGKPIWRETLAAVCFQGSNVRYGLLWIDRLHRRTKRSLERGRRVDPAYQHPATDASILVVRHEDEMFEVALEIEAHVSYHSHYASPGLST